MVDCHLQLKQAGITLRVYQGLPVTHGVSETGHAGMGMVLDFGTLRHTAYLCRGVAGIHRYISKVILIFNNFFSRLLSIFFLLS